ncbi:MAG: hypothetical protein JSW01_02595 [Candidatus Bathyarchaeota archaeon]|nr:MAG: hypothetical protein JSW01_02595 [Candidatus Bathyarchaeota archaeon]
MVKVKNPDGSKKEFKLSEVIVTCELAGSTPYQAACVARELGEYIKDKVEIDSEEVSHVVSEVLRETNEAAAKAYYERATSED